MKLVGEEAQSWKQKKENFFSVGWVLQNPDLCPVEVKMPPAEPGDGSEKAEMLKGVSWIIWARACVDLEAVFCRRCQEESGGKTV